MSLTFLDFFSGIGGFRKGMGMAGHECVGHCEIDKFANMSYKAMHNPKESEWFGTDIRNTRADELPRADVWCFGFPCQDISVAGKQLGFRGHRSSLFFTVTRLIRDAKEEDRPKYLFIENVKNLLSVNGGYDFAKLLIELDEIGYDAEWQVLNSKHFGVPQNRERVFIVGHLRGRSTKRIFPISRESGTALKKIIDGLQGYRVYDPSGVSVTLVGNAGGAGGKTGLYCIGNISNTNHGGGNVYSLEGISPTLKARDYKDPIKIYPVLTPDRMNKRQNGRRIKEEGEPMFTLTSQDRHGVLIKEDTKKGYVEAMEGDSINLEQPNSKTRRGRVGKGVANTLTTSCNQGVLEGARIRKLTPKECFRLQGWKDEYYERAASVCSKSQLYKQAGNGVTVTVIYEIAKRL